MVYTCVYIYIHIMNEYVCIYIYIYICLYKAWSQAASFTPLHLGSGRLSHCSSRSSYLEYSISIHISIRIVYIPLGALPLSPNKGSYGHPQCTTVVLDSYSKLRTTCYICLQY